MLFGNKWERSEVYAFLRLLGDWKIYSCDSDLNRISWSFFSIVKILRDSFSYIYAKKIKIINSLNQELVEVDINEFCQFADSLLQTIHNNNDTTFQVQEIEEFLGSIHQTKLKAPSVDKRDIVITIRDNVWKNRELWYSIKSYLGNNSTLLNASHATNFTFEIKHLPDNKINDINSIASRSKIRDRILSIRNNWWNIIYSSTDSANFLSNLVMIDSNFPIIISNILLNFFSWNWNTIPDLTALIEDCNPLDIKTNKNLFYKAKIKTFLRNVALWMVPNTQWNNQNEVTWWLLIVKRDWEIVCFHIFNRDAFEDYLFKSTKLDTPSSSRHEFWTIYKEWGRVFFKLNLQIRFI